MTVTVSIETVKNVLGLVTAFGAVCALIWKGFKWIHHQKEQDEAIAELKEKLKTQEEAHKKEISDLKEAFAREIANLRDHHDRDIAAISDNHEAAVKSIQEEQTVMTFGILACLRGLGELGCDGPVSDSIDKIEKHINKRAHGQI